MLHAVGKHVHERISYLGRASEIAPMVSVTPEAAAPMKDFAVHTPRDTNREAPHPALQSAVARRLDDEMQMIGLHGVMDDPKTIAPRQPDDRLDQTVQPLRTQTR